MKPLKRYRLAVVAAFPVHYLVPLFRELHRHPRLDTTVYFCGRAGFDEPYLDPEFGDLQIRWDLELLSGYSYRFLPNVSPWPNLVSFWGQVNPRIFSEIMKERYDAVLLFGYTKATELIAMVASWVKRVPVLLRGEMSVQERNGVVKRVVKRIFLRTLFKGIRGFLYSCSAIDRRYRFYGAREGSLFFCPCAVDNETLQRIAKELKPETEAIKRSMGIPEDSTIILYVGKLAHRKRVLDILQAFQSCQGELNTWLVLVGDGPLWSELRYYAESRGIGRVVWAGFRNQSEVGRFYAIADIFVLASEHDPSPKVLNEAMNFALPVVVTDKVGTAGDLVEHGVNGFVYPVGDVAKLAEYLRRLVRDVELRRAMGRQSLERVSEWTFEKDVRAVVEALDTLYASVDKP